MPTFIQTGKMNQDTVQGMMNNPEDRFQAVSDLMAQAGATLKEYYFTTGDSDFLMIVEADSVEAAVAAAMVAGASGAASDIKTRRAWKSSEFKAVAKNAGQIASHYRKPGT